MALKIIWGPCVGIVPHTSNMVFECVEFLQLVRVILRILLFGLTDSSLPVRVARTGTAVQMKPLATLFDFLQRELLTISIFLGGGGSNSGDSHVPVGHL